MRRLAQVEIAHWLDALRRRSRLFLAVVGGVLALGLVLFFVQDPVYQADAEVQLSQPEDALLLGGNAPSADLDAELRLAEDEAIAEKATDVEGAGDVEVVADAASSVLTFTGSGSTPQAAAEIANAHAEAFIAVRKERAEAATRASIERLSDRVTDLDEDIRAITGTDPASIDRVTALRAQRSTYREAADRLEVSLLVGGTTAGRLVTEATPPDGRSSLPLLGYVLVGLVAGAFLGGGTVGLAEFFDRSVKDVNSAREAAGGIAFLGRVKAPREAPVIGTSATGVAVVDSAGSADAESYRRLRSTVRSLVETERPFIHVTSCTSDDGAALVAMNLAAAFAEQGVPTVLICLDLPNGVVLDIEEPSRDEPLAALVSGGAPSAYLARLAGVDGLTVAVRPEEERQDASSGRSSIADALKQLDPVAEVVVLLSPPALRSSMALEIADLVDGTLLVVRERATPLADIEETTRTLALIDSPLLGMVIA